MRGFVNGVVGVALAALAGCGGDTTTDDGREEVEICDDEIDNNDNGLVDCEDSAYCGGLQCATTPTGDDDDDDTNLPVVEVNYAGQPISFTFTPSATRCEEIVETITVINRSETDAAEVDASCDLLGGSVKAMGWRVGEGPARDFVVNEPLAPASTLDVVLLFGCGPQVDAEFTTNCRVAVEGLEESDRSEFQVAGSPI